MKPEIQEYFREIRKLEVRLQDYIKEEETFKQKIDNSITQLKAIHIAVETSSPPLNDETKEKIAKLKNAAFTALSEAMKLQGEAEHEKAHLMESYGALIIELNKIGV